MIVIKRKKTIVEKLQHSLQGVFDISKELNTNILHNYKWREMIQADLMKKIGLDIEEVSGITGDDFKGKGVKKGEFKSITAYRDKVGTISKTRGAAEFDKMNDKIKREDFKKYDCACFTWFDETNPVASVLIKKKKAVEHFQKMGDEKIADFFMLMEKNKKQGKRITRDSIRFTYKDVIKITDAQYFSGHKEITLKEFKKLFGDV